MQIEELKKSAIKLESILEQYGKTVSSARKCLGHLKPYIDDAKAGRMVQPVDTIPCGYTFHEGELRGYSDLENAYSEFSCLARGDDIDEIERIIGDL